MQPEQMTNLSIQKPNTPKSTAWVTWVVVGLVVVAAAAACFWMFNQSQILQSQLNDKTSANTQLEKDKTTLQEENDKLKTSGATVATDKDLILAAADAYVRAPVAAASSKFTYEISDNTSKFAKVKVGVEEGSGYTLTLKKVGANWTVLFGGQDLPLQDMADKYGLPAGYYQ